MFNPWNAPNIGNMGDPNSRFPGMPSWGPFYSGQNFFNPAAPMPYGFNAAQSSMMPAAYAAGFPGYVPQTQPPPPPPPSKEQPPHPPSSQAPSSNNDTSSKLESEWQKYQNSLRPGQQLPNNNLTGGSSLQVTDNPQLREIIAEEQKFNQQYEEWKAQIDNWMEMNKNHPDREKFLEYEKQYKQYENDMLDKQSKLRQRKEEIMKSLQPPPPPPPKPTPPQPSMGGDNRQPPHNWQMSDARLPHPPRNQAPMNMPQSRWNQPGGKGDQVNFGPDINQRFQSDHQHHFQQQPFQHQAQQSLQQQHRPQQSLQQQQRPQQSLQQQQRPQQSLQQQQHRPQQSPQHQPQQSLQHQHQQQQQHQQQHQPQQQQHQTQQPLLKQPLLQHQPQAPHFHQQHRPQHQPTQPRLPPPRQQPLLGMAPAPQNDQPPRWQQRPLLEMPLEAQGPLRHQGNRFPLNQQGSRMGNIVYRPSDSKQHAPSFRPQGPNIMPQDKHTPVSKNVTVPQAPANSQPSGQPASNVSNPMQLQGRGGQEDASSRLGAARRPLLQSHGSDFEPDRKKLRMNMPGVPDAPRPDVSQHHPSPMKGFSGPVRPMGVHRPALNSPSSVPKSDFQPRLQMMGPRFRRQGAAAIAQDFRGSASSQESIKIELLKPRTSPPESREKKAEDEKKTKEGDDRPPVDEKEAENEDNPSDDVQYEVVDEANEEEGDKPTDEKPVGSEDMVVDVTFPSKTSELQGSSQVLKNPLLATPEVTNQEVQKSKLSEPARQFERNSDGNRAREEGFRGHEERFGQSQRPPLLDQDWRDRSFNWNREPVIHDYKHHAPAFLEEQSRNEDKDERYQPGMVQLPNNPYLGTVIDYGHGEPDQNLPPPLNPRLFGAPHLGLDQHHFNDQDFRTPPPFRMNNPEWIPPPMRGGFGMHPGLRTIPRKEDPIIEKIPIDTLLLPPGRTLRPDHLVIMVRGLPGSGKTHLSKLIKEREIKEGGTQPRLLSLDDYFITEVEKVEEDSETKKKVKKTIMEYEFDQSLEPSYKASFLKSFKKHIDDLYFTFIIIDATFDKKIYMDEFWNYAKSKGFQVYIIEVESDPQTCAKRNEHQRTLPDIQKIKDGWDETPRHYLQLEAKLLLEGHIEEVEMDNSSAILENEVKGQSKDSEEGDDSNEPGYQKSKWELDTSEQHLDKLDGLKVVKKVTTMEEYLQVPEDYEQRNEESGKKRVRWADIEERKGLERMKELGFVVGFTDWKKLSDEDECVERALTKTKYI